MRQNSTDCPIAPPQAGGTKRHGLPFKPTMPKGLGYYDNLIANFLEGEATCLKLE
jgi:hypothetical protein